MVKDRSSDLVWGGPVFTVVLVVSFTFMGFLPPLPPSWAEEQVVEHYRTHRTQILTGATLVMQFSGLMFLWVAAVSSQIRKIEGDQARALSYAQLLFGFLANLLFLIMTLSWTVAAFRADRSPELVVMLNDLGWLAIVMPVLSVSLQGFMIGLAILSDPRKRPLFPRWAAYLNFWVGILLLPGAVAPFFKTGPFAWNGFLVFWVPIAAFIGWVFVMAWLVWRAAARDDTSEPSQS